MNDYEHGDLLKKLDSLNLDVPPMPEDFHERWFRQVEDDMEKNKQKKPIRTTLIRVLSAAAALVFIVGGTTIARQSQEQTQEQSWVTAGAAQSKARSANDMAPGSAAPYSATVEDVAYEMEEAADYGVTDMNSSMAVAPEEKMIIRTASLTISTQRYDESLSALRGLCEEAGGWTASSSENTASDGLRTCYLTLRVPAGKLDGFLTGTDALGRIIRRSETAEDVTESYQDNRARLETQETLMIRLRALATSAASLSELLELEAQMADTQYQIDRLQSRLNTTERQVNFATVDVTLREEDPNAGIVDGEKSLGERLKQALKAGGEAFLRFAADAVVWLTAALPFIVVVAVVWLLARFIRKKVRQRR